MNDKNILIQEYNAGDEHQILALFKLVFGRDMSMDYWKWRFQECPSGKGITYLAFDAQKLVGHYTVHPIDLFIDNTIVRSVYSVTTMVHPSYQGRGLFTKLASLTYQKASSLGYKYVFTFPNKNSLHGFTHDLSFHTMEEINLLYTEREKLEGINSVLQYERVFNASEISHIQSELKPDCVFVNPRVLAFLEWRFFLKPFNNYHIYRIMQNEECIAYFVLKIYKNKIVHIIDIQGIQSDDVVKTVLFEVNNFCKQNKIDNISLWLTKNSMFFNLFIEHGFRVDETKIQTLVKSLTSNDDMEFILSHQQNYCPMMADNDNY